MKILSILSMCLSMLIGMDVYSQKTKTDTIKVWGNCDHCKKTIESSLDVRGVKKAEWNKDTQKLVVTYDTTKVDLDKISRLVGEAGYDNEKVKGNEKAYANLPKCCQYNRKE